LIYQSRRKKLIPRNYEKLYHVDEVLEINANVVEEMVGIRFFNDIPKIWWVYSGIF